MDGTKNEWVSDEISTQGQPAQPITEIIKALRVVQANLRGAKKDGVNSFFNDSRYATLASVYDAIRDLLSENELAIIQIIHPDNDRAIVETLLAHTSGQTISSTISLAPTKPTPQGMGSAITYARRYAIMALVGVAPADDDGNDASEVFTAPVKRQPRQKPAPSVTKQSRNDGSTRVDYAKQIATATTVEEIDTIGNALDGDDIVNDGKRKALVGMIMDKRKTFETSQEGLL